MLKGDKSIIDCCLKLMVWLVVLMIGGGWLFYHWMIVVAHLTSPSPSAVYTQTASIPLIYNPYLVEMKTRPQSLNEKMVTCVDA